MKSILEEASSFEKAVEKAWQEAGNPSEFTVKILDPGSKNFLGFSKTPAIISFMYDGKPTPTHTGQRKPSNRPPRRSQNTNAHAAKPAQQRTTTRAPQKQQSPKPAVNRPEPKAPARKIEPAPEWTSELIAGVQHELTESLKCLDVTPTVTHTIKNKHLTFELADSLLESHDEERAFCANLSFLLLQSLKRKMRKKLHGFRLAIHTPTTRLPKDKETAQ